MQMKTKKLAARVMLALVVLGLGWLIRERSAATHAIEWTVAGWALTAVVVLRMGLALRRGAQKMRPHVAQGISLQTLDAIAVQSTPSYLQGLYAMEKRAYAGFWRTLTFAPLRPAGPFSVAGGPQALPRTASLLIAVALCGGALASMLPRWFPAFWPLVGASTALVFALLYALVWILGERRSLREGGHRLENGSLILDLGLRRSAQLALHDIASCVAIGGRAAHEGAVRFTAGERPNVVLALAAPFDAVVLGTAQQIAAPRLLLYVDNPSAFVAAVTQAIAACRTPARVSEIARIDALLPG